MGKPSGPPFAADSVCFDLLTALLDSWARGRWWPPRGSDRRGVAGAERVGRGLLVRAADTGRWIGAGLVCLPLFGALTLWSSLDPQPDPGVDYEAWARFVTADRYVLGHLLGSILGLVFGIFGAFALGAYLAPSRAGRLALWGSVLAVAGAALFLPAMGVSASFAAPEEGQAYLAGVRGLPDLPETLADAAFAATAVVVVLLQLLGNVLLGAAVWRSGTLPRGAGALWAAAPVLMYPLGLVYAATLGPQQTPATVPASAAWIAWSASRSRSGGRRAGLPG